MFYRIRQFHKAVNPVIASSEITWAFDHLPPEAGPLFIRQTKVEQRHALDVALDLNKQKPVLAPSDFQDLIAAALLHDCGKSLVRTRLWHRIFVVILRKTPLSLWSRLEMGSTIFAEPLKAASQHATWGSELARQAGLNPQICRLIYEHHNPTSELGQLLAQADNAH